MDVLEMLTAEPLDPMLDTPLYQQLKARIMQVIATNTLDEKTPLPTEVAIGKALGLSRGTVRRCFEDLVQEGRVVRRRGHGTYVLHKQRSNNVDMLFNFTSEMRALGIEPTSQVVGLRTRTGVDALVKRLGVKPTDEVWEIRRIRYANEEPMQFVTAYVPRNICPVLDRDMLRDSLYKLIFESSGLMPSRAVEVYEAISLDAKEAAALAVPVGAAAMRVIRTTYDQHNQPFETSIIICRGDLNRFMVTLTGDGATFQKVTMQ